MQRKTKTAGPVMQKYTVHLQRQRRVGDMTAQLEALTDAVRGAGGVSAATLADAYHFTGNDGGRYVGCAAEIYLPVGDVPTQVAALCERAYKSGKATE